MKRYAKGRAAVKARRIVAGLLCLALLAGVFPWLAAAQAVSPWVSTTEDYLQQMVDWGVMRGDEKGDLKPEDPITRAEFAAMVNRAYGYRHVAGAGTPFTDVPASGPDKKWYADDVATAYRMGYIKGTSESKFSPNDNLTREQAVVILGRNMMLTPALGEVLAFNDGREFSDWSAGWIQTCAEVGVAIGYEDGSFRPQQDITRGEVAAMLVRALGTLVNGEGETTLGHVSGNVTINTSNTALKDTVVAGDLYLTGGIELGDVLLDNVTVLGRIVAIGAGEGNDAQSSIVLRNCRAEELLVDSVAKQFVSIRTEGNSVVVDKTNVRTAAYLEDRTGAGLGMQLINIDSDTGVGVQLAGNIKNVVNYTPNSVITVARGTADKVSVDEKATGSKVEILNGARVKELNLDVGTTVAGNSMGMGDIDNLHVYSNGSAVEQLPNTIDIRPGVTASINGTVMDTGIAAESSEDPKLLAGYPEARNVAPTAAEAVFSANKAGTVHWALTAAADGSVSKEELLKPSAYSNKIVASGTASLSASGKESAVKLSKLTVSGSYYISAVFVDQRGADSPVKVAAFTTPDNTVPAFASGYPAMGEITSNSGQVKVMATKTCLLYYAVLPKGSAAPTVNNFRTGSISGSLGHGVRPIIKNSIDLFNVNSVSLQEQTDYDVYLCLYDADGGQGSAVKKLTFKTLDGTPPILTNGPVLAPQRTAVRLTAAMNEAGTFYWVVVEAGKAYPDPLPGQSGTPSLNSETAKNAVMMGIGGLKSGSTKVTANRTFTVNISGLAEHTAYDLYYLAVDSAGNSREVQKIRINTVDTQPPTASLEFTSTSDEEGLKPRANTGLRLVFSESIQTYEENQVFLDVYNAMANETNMQKKEILKQEWGALVHSHMTLMLGESSLNNQNEVPQRKDASGSVWVDYSEVTVKMEDRNLVFIFENSKEVQAVQMVSGGKYHFRLSNIKDLANNAMTPTADRRMPTFQINIAEVILTREDPKTLPKAPAATGTQPSEYVRADMWFQVKPDQNARVDEDVFFDVLLWSETNFSFILYGRVVDSAGKPVAVAATTNSNYPLLGNNVTSLTSETSYGSGWRKISGTTPPAIRPGSSANSKAGMSITNIANGQSTATIRFSGLKEFFDKGYIYEFAVQRVGTESEYKGWGDLVRLDVEVVAGTQSDVRGLANSVSQNSIYMDKVDSIGTRGFYVDRQFQSMKPPEFTSGYPSFTLGVNGDREVTINVNLNEQGDVYYALARVDDSGMADLETKDSSGNIVKPAASDDGTKAPPGSGESANNCPQLSAPLVDDILPKSTASGRPEWDFSNEDIKAGLITVTTGRASTTVKGLEPGRTYFAYFVVQSKTNSNITSRVFCYQFTMLEDRTPVITMTYSPNSTGNSQSVGIQTVKDAGLDWVMVNPTVMLPSFLKEEFSSYAIKGFKESTYSRDRDGVPETFSVLDALLEDAGGGRGSVFDAYAKSIEKSTIRTQVQNYISGNVGTEGRISHGTMTFTARNETIAPQNATIANSELPTTTTCFCLAVAVTDTGVLAFKGIEGISVPNRTKPDISKVRGIQITTSKTTGDDGTPNYTYSGRITLEFTETIYFTEKGSGRYTRQVYAAEPTDGTTGYVLLNEAIFADIVKDNSTEAKFAATYPASGQVTYMIRLEFSNVKSGSSLTLFGNGTITNLSGDGLGTPLTIELNDVVIGEGDIAVNGVPHLTVQWAGSKFDGNSYDAAGNLITPE